MKVTRNNLTNIARVLILCIAILLGLMMCGCYTHRTAVKQVTKAQVHFPNVVSNVCGNLYPPKDSTITELKYVEGEPVFFTDTFFVDCDSVVSANNTPIKKTLNYSKPNIIRIPYSQGVRVDTFYKDKKVYTENTAKVQALQGVKDSLNKVLQVQGVKLIITHNKLRRSMWLSLILLAYLAVKTFLRVYIPKFNLLTKFLP
jgi:hypothetical protein